MAADWAGVSGDGLDVYYGVCGVGVFSGGECGGGCGLFGESSFFDTRNFRISDERISIDLAVSFVDFRSLFDTIHKSNIPMDH